MSKCRWLLASTALFCGLATAAHAQFTQQGPKLVGTGGTGQGVSVALSADGNTALVGGPNDNGDMGAVWVFTRSGGAWGQQGTKLVGSGATPTHIGGAFTQEEQGYSVALSADGNTALVGAHYDNNFTGAAWVFTRSGGGWTQQGSKLVGDGALGGPQNQGRSVALSADGNTAVVAGPGAIFGGAIWAFTRSAGVWSQQGPPLSQPGPLYGELGLSVALSADGNTAVASGQNNPNDHIASVWVFTRSAGVWSQQGGVLTGSDAITGSFANFQAGTPVSVSADGDTILLGWAGDNDFIGAAWAFTRTGGVWTQQGPKLVGAGAVGQASQATSVALSADGNLALIGGPADDQHAGATWVFTRTAGAWSQQGAKLIGSGAVGSAFQGQSVALSADGYTALLGGPVDDSSGAAWVFVSPKPSTSRLATSADPSLSGQVVTFAVTVTAGATGTVTFTIDGVPQATVPLTSSQTQFSISNLALGSHSVSAAYSGDPTFAASTSNVVTQVVNTPVITLAANTVVGLGRSIGLPVTLSEPAPPAGLTVYLTSSDPSKVTVTPSVFFAGGQSTLTVQPQVHGLNLGTVSISARALAYAPATQSVRVTATLAFAQCCVSITGTGKLNDTLTLSAPAPAGGLTVQLTSDNPGVATVPATITFPANATSVNVPVTGVAAGGTTIHAAALPNVAETGIRVTVH